MEQPTGTQKSQIKKCKEPHVALKPWLADHCGEGCLLCIWQARFYLQFFTQFLKSGNSDPSVQIQEHYQVWPKTNKNVTKGDGWKLLGTLAW